MAKLIAFDIGQKRTGIAETDSMQIIASGLKTIQTSELLSFLATYIDSEMPECLVIGEPKRLHGVPSEVEPFIQKQINKIKAKYPSLVIERMDERFTSKMASQAIAQSGMSKKKRQNKALIDEVSAVLILQSWMEHRNHKKFNF